MRRAFDMGGESTGAGAAVGIPHSTFYRASQGFGVEGPFAPFGLDGGQPGKCGENVWEHADGRSEVLPALCHLRVLPGDILRIETPGGGGFGES